MFNRPRATIGVLIVVLVVVGVGGATNFVSLDADGLAEFEELKQGTDPLEADTDGDGLTDGVEIAGETDPTVADTDGDGLQDGAEVTTHGTDPTDADTDGDGLGDSTEVEGETDPTVADTDGDGIADGLEVNEHESDPSDADSDGDGLADGTEIEGDTNPTDADTDGDGVADGAEVTDYGTDPTKADTDADGLADGQEVTDYETDPTKADTDGDGLEDGTEVNEYGSDPTNTDTDGDGLSDGAEATSQPLTEADPTRMDVFVELDYMAGYEPSAQALSMIEATYAEAPVENPDGSTGIDLHVFVDDEIPVESTTDIDDRDRIMRSYFDNDSEGYRYAISVVDVRRAGEDVAGLTWNSFGTSRIMFQTSRNGDRAYQPDETADILLHELGHSLGLYPTTYSGVDSDTIPYEDYTSVMNYNAPWGTVKYNAGEPFDDWEYITNNMYTPWVQS